ncbi:hypothetical protein [Altererythrobacter sp. KTW20L]|nr:hypothetical protein [Altererythrobacter sp. KTW20L]
MASQAAVSQATDEAAPGDDVQVVLSPAELFIFADNARDAGIS